jgi:hypothetical protein
MEQESILADMTNIYSNKSNRTDKSNSSKKLSTT